MPSVLIIAMRFFVVTIAFPHLSSSISAQIAICFTSAFCYWFLCLCDWQSANEAMSATISNAAVIPAILVYFCIYWCICLIIGLEGADNSIILYIIYYVNPDACNPSLPYNICYINTF